MNFRVLVKSIRFAFRARKRVLFFMIIYAVLYIQLGNGLGSASGTEGLWLLSAFVVATVYAILIAQFRRRDIAILKCISWQNSDVLLLLVGEVVLVSLAAFLLVFNLSVYILGLTAYVAGIGPLLTSLYGLIYIEADYLVLSVVVIVLMQLPGLALAHYRAMKVSPMRALRGE